MKIVVYCGSTPGNNASFVKSAFDLGSWMGKNGHELIYGGSKTGLMGAISDGVLSSGGAVTGVVPNVPQIKERIHPGITTVIETESIADRKTCMIDRADAFIALPGGLGTLDEITEILSLESLGLVHGPVIFYNMNNYYDPMKTVLANILSNEFGIEEFFADVSFADSLEDIAKAIDISQ